MPAASAPAVPSAGAADAAAAARQQAAASRAAGGLAAGALCDWIDRERLALLNPGAASLRQLLGEGPEAMADDLPLLLDVGAMGAPCGGASAAAAGLTAAPVSAAASTQPGGVPLLSSDELDQLLVGGWGRGGRMPDLTCGHALQAVPPACVGPDPRRARRSSGLHAHASLPP